MKDASSHEGLFPCIRIDEQLCNGCVVCMRACPTKAIRTRGGRPARIEGVCIDCGECIRACPRSAVKAVIPESDSTKRSRYTVISVSPVLHSQFGEEATPNEILLALRRKFKFVYDQAHIYELCNAAAEIYVREKRAKEEAGWPLISPFCPVVTLLIEYRFPGLLKNLLPLITPREIAARELKKRLCCETDFQSEELGVYHVTPCSAKLISIKEPMSLERSYIDGVMGINEVYDVVKKNLRDVQEDIMLHSASGVGMGWGISGGEIAGMGPGKYLAVSGIQETIRYLEKIEMGLLQDMEYVEFRACAEGCVGGPLNVVDKYQAKRTLQRLTHLYGMERKITYARVQTAYEEGWFFGDKKRFPPDGPQDRLPVSETVKRQEQIEDVLGRLPRKECGVCGSPDCRTFAEDVVEGKADLEGCPFLKR